MSKLLKILFLILILFIIFIPFVQATDVDMNLPSEQSNTTEQQNTMDNSVNENQENSGEDYNSLQPTSINKTETGLGVTNIINILLITVGVILILLAIAILIRLKF